MSSYVYVLRCGDGSLYTGWTNNLKQRLAAHKNGKGAKYTKGRTPIELVYFEEFGDINIAIEREKQLKASNRKNKESLINIKNPDWLDLGEDWLFQI